jgi:O-antigen ligase
MDSRKLIFSIITGVSASIITFCSLYQPEIVLLIAALGAYSWISYKHPFTGLMLLFLLPILGEFSRLNILGRSLVLSDLIIPLFEITALIGIKKINFSKSIRKQLQIIGIFIIIAIFSLLFSLTTLSLNDVFQSSLYLIRLVIYFGLLPISYLIIRKTTTSKAITYITISAILIAGTGLLQLIYLPTLEDLAKSAGYDPHINRLVGSWLDPNFIGGFFAIITVFLISLSLYENSNRKKVFYFISSLIFTTALFFTYSRSAYLALAAGILTLGLLKARKLLIIFIILASIGVASSERAQQRLGELTTSVKSVIFNTSENPDPTARLRLQNWEQTINLISQKPLLGHGYNTLSIVKLASGYIQNTDIHSASGSDSSLLTILATTGILGLIPFLIFIFNILLHSFTSWKNSTNKKTRGISLGIFCSIFVLLIHCNFVNSLFFPQIMIYLWVLLGIFYRHQKDLSSD